MIYAPIVLAYAQSFIGSWAYASGAGHRQKNPSAGDCVDFVRWILRHMAARLWPTAWGAPDPWTIVNLYGALKAKGFTIVSATIGNIPRRGDLLFYGTTNRLTHVAMCFDPTHEIGSRGPGVGIYPIASHTTPLRYIVRMGMKQEDPMKFHPRGVPTGFATTGTDTRIRALLANGDTIEVPLGKEIATYGETEVDGVYPGAAYVIIDSASGQQAALLRRNVTSWRPVLAQTPISGVIHFTIDPSTGERSASIE